MQPNRIALVTALSCAVILAAIWASPAHAQETPETPPSCAGEVATIVAVAGEPTIGTDERDVIVGTSGADRIRGLGGADIICGLGGDDDLNGDDGDDMIWGAGGADVIRGGRGNDVVVGGPRNDRLIGGAGADDLGGSKGDDELIGARGGDDLRGGPGTDVLWGKAGDDTLRGGGGDDDCKPGRGRDLTISCNELDEPPLTFAVGDSIMVGAGSSYCNQLAKALPGVTERSAVSRQFVHAQPIVETARKVAPDAELIIIALGTNGSVPATALDALFEIDPLYRFVFVNIRAPRSWETTVNAAISAGVARHPERAVLVDWNAIASANPRILAGDGIHLTCTGAAVYAQAIADGVARLTSR